MGPNTAQPIGPQEQTIDERSVREVPGVRMRRIEPAERGKELPAFQLKVKRQTGCLHECLFDFDLGFVVVVQFENNVREAFKVGIDGAVERKLDIACIETALLGS